MGGAVGSVASEVSNFYEAWTEGPAEGWAFLASLPGLLALAVGVVAVPSIFLSALFDREQWGEAAVMLAVYPVLLFVFLSGTASLGLHDDPVSLVRGLTGW
jgi:hypothetical protein